LVKLIRELASVTAQLESKGLLHNKPTKLVSATAPSLMSDNRRFVHYPLTTHLSFSLRHFF